MTSLLQLQVQTFNKMEIVVEHPDSQRKPGEITRCIRALFVKQPSSLISSPVKLARGFILRLLLSTTVDIAKFCTSPAEILR